MRWKLLLIIALCLSACTTDKKGEEEIINIGDMEPETVNISEFTSGMDAVRLETSEDCLLGPITHIEFAGEFIYIKDIVLQGIYVFDRAGKFIGKLYKEGRGAGEYLTVDDFVIDEAQNTIEIFDGRSNKLFVYGLSDFSFIKAISVPLSVAFRFIKGDNIYYFNSNGLRNEIGGEKTNSEIIAFDPVTNKLTPLFDKILPDDYNRSWHLSECFSRNTENEIFISMAWQDVFYKIENLSANPLLAIDAGRYTIPDHVKTGTYEQQEEYMNSDVAGKKYFFFKLALYDRNNIIISFTQGTKEHTPYYYMRFGNREYLTKKIRNDFIPGQPDLTLNSSIIRKNRVVTLVMPDRQQSPEIEQYLGSVGVQPEDNPVLLLFDIK